MVDEGAPRDNDPRRPGFTGIEGVGAYPSPEDIDRYGYAGVVANAPYGPGFPDDLDEWEETSKGFRRYIDRGMKIWIYDEDGYPSGSAGGKVLEKHPDHPEYEAAGLYFYEFWRTLSSPFRFRADLPDGKLECAMLIPLDGSEAIDITDHVNENGVLYIDIPEGSYHACLLYSKHMYEGTHATESYSEPRRYINVCDADATRAFMDVIHKNYERVLSDEFGKGVSAFFTDEPSLISWNLGHGVLSAYPILPWHRDFPKNFKKTYGYSIFLAAAAVVRGKGPEVIKRRCDFWEFVSNTVAENFFGVIEDWCRAHNIASSGHMVEEEHLKGHVQCYGSFYRSARRMGWPGVDVLTSDPQRLMDTSGLPHARFVASIGELYGVGETFTEFSDHFERMKNKQIGTDWLKAAVNWHFAMGINNLTSCYDLKNFTAEQMQFLNLYTSRLGYMIRQGKRQTITAMLYPEASMWAAYVPESKRMSVTKGLDEVDEVLIKASWDLIHRQIEFDYVMEETILEGTIRDGGLEWKGHRYECLILPDCRVLSAAAIHRLVELLKAGITVVFLNQLPGYIRETGAEVHSFQLFHSFMNQKNFALVPVSDGWKIPGICSSFRTVSVQPHNLQCVFVGAGDNVELDNGKPISANILTHTREQEDGSLLTFVCNMGGKPYDGELHLENGVTVTMFDPETGECKEIPIREEADFAAVDVMIRPYEGFVYWIQKK